MGLDLTAYSRVELLETMSDYEAYEAKYGWDDLTVRYIYERQDFADRMPPIVGGGVYKIHGDRFAFHGGSYSGYNIWRNDLSLFALGLQAAEVWARRDGFRGCAFYELIDFSDCEGVIGTIACAKLAADFDRFQERAALRIGDDYWYTKYSEWRKAFHLAADNGFIDFH